MVFARMYPIKTDAMKNITIGIIAGSLRREAYSRRIAAHIAGLAPEGFDFRIIDIGGLPLYNQDFDDMEEAPDAYGPFRREIGGLDGVVFVTPEHNRSMPAALKNAIDVASRPSGSNAWSGKPGAVVSVSNGRIGGFGAAAHLRQSMMVLNMPLLPQPEIYIGEVQNVLDAEGKVADPRTEKRLGGLVDKYTGWVRLLAGR